ncbi:VanW family protein [Sphingomonas asaccharolytica]|uniref:VanW family protein n=1 Tax=Sphingomonas asaccharolytica TaxID=40681 RepID=UPI00082E16C3|nr:VanW family protein [Sphingomonas asaccharolytica]
MSDRLANVTALPDRAVPTRIGNLVFETKAALLRLRRAGSDLILDAPKRHRRGEALVAAPILATIRSPLWTTRGGTKDRTLNAGKIQNLRAAISGLDGIEIGAGDVLSFWRQVGKPLRRRGFVEGRELREGCMIATVGGGLCQLSNALHEAALDAGLEVVERHAHTRIVPGSRAEAGRDATVLWNYLDFRIRSRSPFRVEARLTADELILTIRGVIAGAFMPVPEIPAGATAHDCLSCGQTTCHRHNPDDVDAGAPTAWLVDGASPEFVALIRDRAGPDDVLMLSSRRFGKAAAAWPALAAEYSADLATLRRSLALRSAGSGTPRARILLEAEARLAAAYARRLGAEHTHLVVAQPLLPHLWRLGALRGRSFEVVLDRLPIDAMHRVLDAARDLYPDSATLGDFRAAEAIAAAEREALGEAVRLITPHSAIAARFPPTRVDLIDWQAATPLPATRGGRTFLFAAPALARKGAHAMREAMEQLDIALLLERPGEERPGFWGDRDVRLAQEVPSQLAGVILPAIVEHRPATLLRALAAGLPVIATEACGLPPQPGLTLIEPCDSTALREAIRQVLS